MDEFKEGVLTKLDLIAKELKNGCKPRFIKINNELINIATINNIVYDNIYSHITIYPIRDVAASRYNMTTEEYKEFLEKYFPEL